MFNPGEVIVQKYGGSSVASSERISRVAERIAEIARTGRRMAVVVSAMGDTTDDLISLMHSVNPDPDSRELDQLMATGEIASCSLLAAALSRLGIKARSFTAHHLQIQTDGNFGSAEIKKFGKIEVLASFLKPASVAVVAGFQGISPTGDLTTLGRGGTDITAVSLASELGQMVCEKLTDEEGIYSADPKFIPTARKIWHLDYNEMKNLSVFGNGILNPRAIDVAQKYNIRINVRSSFKNEEGSIVGPDGDLDIPLKSLTCDKKQALVSIERIPGSGLRCDEISGKVFSFQPSVREIRKNERNGSDLKVCFHFKDAFDAMPMLWQEAVRLNAEDLVFHAKIYMLSVVGCGLKKSPQFSKRLIEALSSQGINILINESTDVRFSVAVSSEHGLRAMELLHKTLLDLNNESRQSTCLK
ncbi:MAG: aspartate kinase [Candidatus Riflebacteria bacterium]|nr:aspartate kinase [Candidatus Riflebacteria bacterium]